MSNRIDYSIALLIGFLTGVFAIPTLLNIGIRSKGILIFIPLLAPPLFVFGIWFGKFLSRRLSFFYQFGKFAAVGFLNTAIDFGILHLLSATTGVTEGFRIGGVNVPGFGAAAFNGYFWNQLWVFRARDKDESFFHDFPTFLVVTIAGALVNSAVVVFITTYVPFFEVFSKEMRLTLAKVAATVISMVWNFVGYKFLVFRRG